MGRFGIQKAEGLSKHYSRRVDCPYCGAMHEIDSDYGCGSEYVECTQCEKEFEIGWFTETSYYGKPK